MVPEPVVKAKLIKDVKHLMTGEVVHKAGEIIELKKNTGWCGTFPYSHQCPKCEPCMWGIMIHQIEEYFETKKEDE